MLNHDAFVPKERLSRLQDILLAAEKARAQAQGQRSQKRAPGRRRSEPRNILDTIENMVKEKINSMVVAKGERPAALSPAEDRELTKVYDSQLELLLTEECVLCSDMFIEGVDIPFDSQEEYEWAV